MRARKRRQSARYLRALAAHRDRCRHEDEAMAYLLSNGLREAVESELRAKFTLRPPSTAAVEEAADYAIASIERTWVGANLWRRQQKPERFTAFAIHQAKLRAKERLGRQLRRKGARRTERLEDLNEPDRASIVREQGMTPVEDEVLGRLAIEQAADIVRDVCERDREAFWNRYRKEPWEEVGTSLGLRPDAARMAGLRQAVLVAKAWETWQAPKRPGSV